LFDIWLEESTTKLLPRFALSCRLSTGSGLLVAMPPPPMTTTRSTMSLKRKKRSPSVARTPQQRRKLLKKRRLEPKFLMPSRSGLCQQS
jgi:hypothetical protein